MSDNDEAKNRCKWEELHWPNTVHLSLSVKQPNNVFTLLHQRALPILERLCINVMKEDEHRNKSTKNYLNLKTMTVITNHLRYLQLCNMSLDDLLTLLSSVYMPLLETLTLIDIYGDSKFNHLTLSIFNQLLFYFSI